MRGGNHIRLYSQYEPRFHTIKMIKTATTAASLIPLVATLLFAQPTLGTNPAIPASLHVSTFATGLDFPYGIYQLPDGSMLVATNTGTGLYGSPMKIVRLTETNGVANAPTTVFTSSLLGPATALTGVGDIVAVASGVHTGSAIVLFRAGPGGSLTKIGEMTFTYPANAAAWWHDSHSIALRAVTGQPNSYELVFNVGSEFNDIPTVNTVGVAGLTNATLNGSSLYSLQFTVSGSTVTAGTPTQIATGLRNAFAIGFGVNGDIYFSENGIDLGGTNTPVSTDYFARIPAGTSGILDFGFPYTYYDPITGAMVGSAAGISQPFSKFLPINGMAFQGAGGLTMAPSTFPPGLNNGAFVGFFGNRFDGVANTLGGVVYVDLATGDRINFLPNTQAGVSHPVSLFASNDALYIADFADIFGSNNGTIYKVSMTTTVPEPSTFALLALGATVVFGVRRRRSR